MSREQRERKASSIAYCSLLIEGISKGFCMVKKSLSGFLILAGGIMLCGAFIFTACKQSSTAQPNVKIFTVIFNSNGGSVVSPVTVESGKTIAKPADPVKAHYAFAGWFRDNNVWDNEWNFAADMVTDNITLYAKWEPAAGTTSFTVTFVSNCAATLADKNVVENDSIDKPLVSNPGNVLIGWFTTETFANGTEWNFDTDKVTENITLYAKWERIEGPIDEGIVVTFNSNGGSAVSRITNVPAGTAIAKPEDPSKYTYTFGGWYKEAALTNPWNFASDTVSVSITLYAKWDDDPAFTGTYLIFNGPLITDVSSSGMRVRAQGDTIAPVMGQYGGQWALKGSDFIYWYIDDAAVKAAAAVTLGITYYDNVSGSFGIQYRSQNDAHQYGLSIQKNGTGEYVTVWVTLPDCGFTLPGHNHDAQFRFESGGAIIKSVKITIGALPDPLEKPAPVFAVQTELNNIIGKGIAGYQAWFSAGTGSDWGHWARDYNGIPPGPDYVNVEMWPDVEDYPKNGATLYATNFSPLGDGRPALVFNSRDREVIFTHFQWMQEYGIDSAAVQRFYGYWPAGESAARNHLMDIQDAAEATGRSFYVLYDFSGWNASKSTSAVKSEWILNIEQKGVASSPNYAHAEGKPVVCLWGLGNANDNNWLPDAAAIDLAVWFRNRGYFVIGGSEDNPITWAGQPQSHETAYAAFDMLMPWPVGRYGQTWEHANGWMHENLPVLGTFCAAHPRSWAGNKPILYMGGIYTGGGWTNLGYPGSPNWPAKYAGQPMWDQLSLLLGGNYPRPDNFYIAMFDEYDESTAIMKAGRDYFDIPTDQWFLTFSVDGWWLSSDYYLRVAGAAVEIIKGQRQVTPAIDIPHSLGPLYWRNSFEKRDGWKNITHVGPNGSSGTREKVADIALDPCLNNPGLLANKSSGAALTTNAIVKASGKSGLWVFHLAGSGNGGAYYKIADVKINSSAALQLKYSLKPLDAGGRGVFVDILFADGSLLSESNNSVIAQRGTVNQWGGVTVTGIPANKAISGVVVGYSGSGAFSAHVDDIIIEKP